MGETANLSHMSLPTPMFAWCRGTGTTAEDDTCDWRHHGNDAVSRAEAHADEAGHATWFGATAPTDDPTAA